MLFLLLNIVREQVDDMMDKVNKQENTARVRKVLENTELSDESIELILNSINELQERMTDQFNTKLESFVSMDTYEADKGEQKVIERKLATAEENIEKALKSCRENAEMADNNRKRA